jgi:hypothetical protein
MQIFVKNKKTYTFNVDYSDTIKSIQEKIYDREGLPERFYYLTCNGKILDSERILSDYNITEQSTIFVNLKLAGN